MADNRRTAPRRPAALRLITGRSSLLAAAAVAGAVVYWRAMERRRARQAAEIDDAVVEGREAAQRLLDDQDAANRPFDQR